MDTPSDVPQAGQLVWYDVSLGGTEWNKGPYLKQAKVCSRVVDVTPDGLSCTIQMAYMRYNGIHWPTYTNHKNETVISGSRRIVPVSQLERHISGSGTIWWILV